MSNESGHHHRNTLGIHECPTCGHPCLIASSDEGTNHYSPIGWEDERNRLTDDISKLKSKNASSPDAFSRDYRMNNGSQVEFSYRNLIHKCILSVYDQDGELMTNRQIVKELNRLTKEAERLRLERDVLALNWSGCDSKVIAIADVGGNILGVGWPEVESTKDVAVKFPDYYNET